jgi:hypothetical protein
MHYTSISIFKKVSCTSYFELMIKKKFILENTLTISIHFAFALEKNDITHNNTPATDLVSVMDITFSLN